MFFDEDTHSKDLVLHRCIKAAVTCIFISFICAIYYALSVRVLQDGTLYEPEFVIIFSRVAAIVGIALGVYAAWRWTDHKED